MEEAGRVLQVVAHQVDMVLEQDNRLLFNIQSLRVVDQHQIFASCFFNAGPERIQIQLFSQCGSGSSSKNVVTYCITLWRAYCSWNKQQRLLRSKNHWTDLNLRLKFNKIIINTNFLAFFSYFSLSRFQPSVEWCWIQPTLLLLLSLIPAAYSTFVSEKSS